MQEEEKKIALYENFKTINSIDPAYYEQYDVKRGLRNADGTGVVAGLTNIANVHGYVVSDNEKIMRQVEKILMASEPMQQDEP